MFENDFGNFPTKLKDYTEIKSLMLQHVIAYANKHLDNTDLINGFDVYFVWYSKILKNSKALISTSLPDGMYYEVTYNGEKDEFYLDAYKKFENVRIHGDSVYGVEYLGKSIKDSETPEEYNDRYTWVKFADTPTSGMSDSPVGKAYIGIAINQTSPVDSANYSDYDWSPYKIDVGGWGR